MSNAKHNFYQLLWDILYAFYVTDLRFDTISVSWIKSCL